MNRKPNKVNQTITFLVFIFLCYEAFGLIKPSSGKFPEAEPVQLSNDNIVKHLQQLMVLVQNIQDLDVDIPQLMVEFVLVILKDLISIKTHVKKNPHQLNPHQHAQLETTISKCEIELTNLQSKHQGCRERAKNVPMLAQTYLAQSWDGKQFVWIKDFCQNLELLWQKQEQMNREVIPEAFLISIWSVLLTLMRKPLGVIDQMVNGFVFQLKLLLAKVRVVHDKFMKIREQKAQQYSLHKSLIDLGRGGDGDGDGAVSDQLVDYTIDQQLKGAHSRQPTLQPTQPRASGFKKPQQFSLGKATNKYCLRHYEYYLTISEWFFQNPSPFSKIILKCFVFVLRQLLKYKKECINTNVYPQIVQLIEKVRVAVLAIQSLPNLRRVPQQWGLQGVQTKITTFTKEQDFPIFSHELNIGKKKIETAEQAKSFQEVQKVYCIVEDILLTLLSKCVFGKQQNEDQQSHQSLVDQSKSMLKEMQKFLLDQQEKKTIIRQKVNLAGSGLVSLPSTSAEEIVAQIFPPSPQHPSGAKPKKPKIDPIQRAKTRRTGGSKLQKLKIAAKKFNIQLVDLHQIQLMCTTQLWQCQYSLKMETNTIFTFLEKVQLLLRQEISILQDPFKPKWLYPQYLFYYCKFLRQQVARWKGTIVTRHEEFVRNNNMNVNEPFLNEIEQKGNQMVSKLNKIMDKCLEEPLSKEQIIVVFCIFQSPSLTHQDYLDIIKLANFFVRLLGAVRKELQPTLQTEIQHPLLEYFLTQLQMFAAMLRSFQMNCQTSICQKLMPILTQSSSSIITLLFKICKGFERKSQNLNKLMLQAKQHLETKIKQIKALQKENQIYVKARDIGYEKAKQTKRYPQGIRIQRFKTSGKNSAQMYEYFKIKTPKKGPSQDILQEHKQQWKREVEEKIKVESRIIQENLAGVQEEDQPQQEGDSQQKD